MPSKTNEITPNIEIIIYLIDFIVSQRPDVISVVPSLISCDISVIALAVLSAIGFTILGATSVTLSTALSELLKTSQTPTTTRYCPCVPVKKICSDSLMKISEK